MSKWRVSATVADRNICYKFRKWNIEYDFRLTVYVMKLFDWRISINKNSFHPELNCSLPHFIDINCTLDCLHLHSSFQFHLINFSLIFTRSWIRRFQSYHFSKMKVKVFETIKFYMRLMGILEWRLQNRYKRIVIKLIQRICILGCISCSAINSFCYCILKSGETYEFIETLYFALGFSPSILAIIQYKGKF